MGSLPSGRANKRHARATTSLEGTGDRPTEPIHLDEAAPEDLAHRRPMIARTVIAAALAAALAFGSVAVFRAVTADKPSITAFRGARLGMSARDVRDRFEPAAPGRWQTVNDAGEMTMTWAANGEPATVAGARFEFHAGMLVAVRARIDAHDSLGSGPDFDVSPGAVLQRAPAGPGMIAVTILARDCPTHAAEVTALLASHPRP